VLSLVLVYAYRALGPRRPAWGPLLCGSFFTGAFISGFLQGCVIFLAIPVNLGSPFGGLRSVGGAVAVTLVAVAVHRPGGPGLRHHPVPRGEMDAEVNTRLVPVEE